MATKAVFQGEITGLDPLVTGTLRTGSPSGLVAVNNFFNQNLSDSGTIETNIATEKTIASFAPFDFIWDGTTSPRQWIKGKVNAAGNGYRFELESTLKSGFTSDKQFNNEALATDDIFYFTDDMILPPSANQVFQTDEANHYKGVLSATPPGGGGNGTNFCMKFDFICQMGSTPQVIFWTYHTIRENNEI